MEINIESEFECQICMDLLIEPVTTVCGHTFCKICLIRYLKTKLNCPMCRKTILQSKDSLNKNVLLENLVKSKHLKYYEEKLKINKMSYDEETINGEDNSRNNIPTIMLEDCYIWPKIKRKMSITNLMFEITLTVSSVNDRLLIIIPSNVNLNGSLNDMNTIACLVEINSIHKRENSIDIEVTGLKRFRVKEIKNANENVNNNPLFVCNGEIIKDLEIDSTEILEEIYLKLRNISQMHDEILKFSPYSLVKQIEKVYGKMPPFHNNNISMSTTILEPVSYFYLNLIKNENKKKFYLTNNLYERTEWINEQYANAVKHIGNQSLAFNFFDLQIAGQPKDSLKFTLILFSVILLLFDECATNDITGSLSIISSVIKLFSFDPRSISKKRFFVEFNLGKYSSKNFPSGIPDSSKV